MKPVLVLRPQPGNDATADRARAVGLEVWQCPLFEVRPVAWTAPDPGEFDYILLTSANALRCGGDALSGLAGLPALAVGPVTAAAARAAGFQVAMVGTAGAEALLARLPAPSRLLHLAGVNHRSAQERHQVTTIETYCASALDPALPDGACVALVHSARAGAHLAALAPDRRSIAIAAISTGAAEACGAGWCAIEAVAQPDETALLALAARLCQD